MSDDSQLTIKVDNFKKVDLVTTSGRIDSSNAAEFDEVLKELMHGGQHHIVINMADINYMSSAGLRTLVSALRECKKKKGDVRLSSPRSVLRKCWIYPVCILCLRLTQLMLKQLIALIDRFCLTVSMKIANISDFM